MTDDMTDEDTNPILNDNASGEIQGNKNDSTWWTILQPIMQVAPPNDLINFKQMQGLYDIHLTMCKKGH